MEVNFKSKEEIKNHLKQCLEFIGKYKFLSESYIIQFFTEDLWRKLPESWQHSFDNLQPEDMKKIVLEQNEKFQPTLPLSFMAFKTLALRLPIVRDNGETPENILQQIFKKNVNPKKQHEIQVLSQVIEENYTEMECTQIIDIGSGRGHLSRLLSLGQGMNVTAVESQEKLVTKAQELDEKMMKIIKRIREKRSGSEVCLHQEEEVKVAHHINHHIDFKTSHFLQQIDSNDDSNCRYLLTGLHACGSLSCCMIRTFASQKQIKSLISVACCYMKMINIDDNESCDGFPMSKFVSSLPQHQLGYKSLELSCHSIENYRLRFEDDVPKLKVHCMRGVLEKLIVNRDPNLKCSIIHCCRNSHLLTFQDYASRAFKHLNFEPLTVDELKEGEELLEKKWRNVTTYFSISLLLAPVIETIVLLDRMLFLLEQGYQPKLKCLFDPVLSPRCFVIICNKSEKENNNNLM